MELGIGGRVALVMGASQGIGRGIALALAREGAEVALSSRSEGKLEQVAAEARELGAGAAAVFAADTRETPTLPGLIERVEEQLGPIEILVLNTGGPPGGGALDHDAETWRTAYESLVLAPRVLCEAVIPGMRERSWGRIVNVASSSIREPIPGLTLSNSNRMAAVGFLKTLANEVAADGVTVNTVATGMFATDRLAELFGSAEAAAEAAAEQIPAGRLGKPEEFGDLVAFLCSERAAYLTGSVIPLDGGRLRSV